jgi:uncharacterized glyoxalase superfamily protein PhnB
MSLCVSKTAPHVKFLNSTGMQNRTMPSATIIPVLGCIDLIETIDWLTRVYQFTERWRVGDHRAQLRFGDGTIAVTKQKHFDLASLIVQVKDVDAHYEYAKQQGAAIVQPPVDFPYGERQYSTEDLNGHLWSFSQSVQDLAPEDWGGTSHTL